MIGERVGELVVDGGWEGVVVGEAVGGWVAVRRSVRVGVRVVGLGLRVGVA